MLTIRLGCMSRIGEAWANRLYNFSPVQPIEPHPPGCCVPAAPAEISPLQSMHYQFASPSLNHILFSSSSAPKMESLGLPSFPAGYLPKWLLFVRPPLPISPSPLTASGIHRLHRQLSPSIHLSRSHQESILWRCRPAFASHSLERQNLWHLDLALFRHPPLCRLLYQHTARL